jgi:hypothetical protein
LLLIRHGHSSPVGRRAPLSLAALLVVAACGAGCKFEPKFSSGTIPCSSSKECPPGFACVEAYCYAAGILPDGAAGGGGTGDAREVDGGRDAAADQGLSPDRPVDGAADAGGDRGAEVSGDVARFDAGDGGCSTVCTLGDKRCGTFGLQTCVLVGGCPSWGQDALCPGRQTCQGSAPGARCTCPAPPAGCEGGRGSVCVGTVPATARACDVDGEGCVFTSTETPCTSGKPCAGSFPNGVCTCPAPPAICGGHGGTFCQSPTSIQTCGNNSDGCLTVTRTTPCDPSKPCAVVGGTATCSCTSAPAECGGAVGGACRANGELATCDLDGSGCLAVVSSGPCGPGLTCQGTAPNASCRCPAAPAVCGGTTGTFCQGAAVVTCRRDNNGCLGITATATCTGVQTCGGSPGTARCTCPAPPAQCPGGAGKLCDGSGNLVNCVADANQCISVASSGPCGTGLVCGGQFPNAACGCPPPPAACKGATSGNVCQSPTSYVSCATNAQGCVVVSSSNGACPGGSKPCTGEPGQAVCACSTSAPPECFLNGVFMTGGACASGRLTRCASDGNGCQSGTSMACGTQTCQGTLPNAVCACSGAPDCSVAGGEGTHCSGSTLIRCTATGQGCFTEATTTCTPPQACVGNNPVARCADEVAYGVPKPAGTESESWTERFVAIPIRITEATTLRRFGLIWAGNGATPPAGYATRVMFGLYPNGAGALGAAAPVGKLIAGAIVSVSDPGNVEVAPMQPAAGERPVPAGNYWVLINIEAASILPIPIRGVPSVTRLATPESAVLTFESPFAKGLPTDIPNTAAFVAGAFKGPLNVYLIGMPQQ